MTTSLTFICSYCCETKSFCSKDSSHKKFLGQNLKTFLTFANSMYSPLPLTLTATKIIQKTCDIGDTHYSSNNWQAEYMTIFVTWHLSVTLNSMSNSCDIFFTEKNTKKSLLRQVTSNFKTFHLEIRLLHDTGIIHKWELPKRTSFCIF